MKVMMQDVRIETPQVSEEFFAGRFGERQFFRYGPQVIRLTMTAVVVAAEFEEIREGIFGVCELLPVQAGASNSKEVKALLEYGRRKIMK